MNIEQIRTHYETKFQLLFGAIKEALHEMEKCPNDSVQDIWNESLKSWNTNLEMDGNYNIDPTL